MKLEYTSGCICDSLNVDGVEIMDMAIEDVRNVVRELLNREQNLATLQDVFMSMISSQGVYEHSKEPCDCCGDYITTYKLEI